MTNASKNNARRVSQGNQQEKKIINSGLALNEINLAQFCKTLLKFILCQQTNVESVHF